MASAARHPAWPSGWNGWPAPQPAPQPHRPFAAPHAGTPAWPGQPWQPWQPQQQPQQPPFGGAQNGLPGAGWQAGGEAERGRKRASPWEEAPAKRARRAVLRLAGQKRSRSGAACPAGKRVCLEEVARAAPTAALRAETRALALRPPPRTPVSIGDLARGCGTAVLTIDLAGRVLNCNSPDTFAALANLAAVTLRGLPNDGAIVPASGVARACELVEAVVASPTQCVAFDGELAAADGEPARVSATAFVVNNSYIACLVRGHGPPHRACGAWPRSPPW